MRAVRVSLSMPPPSWSWRTTRAEWRLSRRPSGRCPLSERAVPAPLGGSLSALAGDVQPTSAARSWGRAYSSWRDHDDLDQTGGEASAGQNVKLAPDVCDRTPALDRVRPCDRPDRQPEHDSDRGAAGQLPG